MKLLTRQDLSSELVEIPVTENDAKILRHLKDAVNLDMYNALPYDLWQDLLNIQELSVIQWDAVIPMQAGGYVLFSEATFIEENYGFQRLFNCLNNNTNEPPYTVIAGVDVIGVDWSENLLFKYFTENIKPWLVKQTFLNYLPSKGLTVTPAGLRMFSENNSAEVDDKVYAQYFQSIKLNVEREKDKMLAQLSKDNYTIAAKSYKTTIKQATNENYHGGFRAVPNKPITIGTLNHDNIKQWL